MRSVLEGRSVRRRPQRAEQRQRPLPQHLTARGSAVLEFATEIDGVTINGVDLIWWNEAGLITRFKVMIRPLKAINLLHRLMRERLAAAG